MVQPVARKDQTIKFIIQLLFKFGPGYWSNTGIGATDPDIVMPERYQLNQRVFKIYIVKFTHTLLVFFFFLGGGGAGQPFHPAENDYSFFVFVLLADQITVIKNQMFVQTSIFEHVWSQIQQIS